MNERIKVLAVDDEEMSLAMLSTILDSQGMECTTATNGREALDVLESQPDTDIVLLDLQMPVMDGFEVLSHCKNNPYLNDIPIIVLAADRQEKLKSLKLGADDFLAKPYDVEELELRITRLNQARNLAQSAKRAKNEFLTIARNELRTPMLNLMELTELLDGNNLTADQHKTIQRLKQATGSLTGIFRDILNYVQLDHQAASAIVEPFSLLSTIQGALDAQQDAAGRNGIRLELSMADSIPDHLSGPSFYVYKVCDILLENAVKFSSGGEVRVSIKEESHDRHVTRLICSVSDQGIGIPSEYHEKIFEPFVQVGAEGRESSGIGLGLPIAKRMVELMGGTISMKSESGSGSSFNFSFQCDTLH